MSLSPVPGSQVEDNGDETSVPMADPGNCQRLCYVLSWSSPYSSRSSRYVEGEIHRS